MQLFTLPCASCTSGCVGEKRHSLSTMNLYWNVPTGRFRHTVKSLLLCRIGMRSAQLLNVPVT